ELRAAGVDLYISGVESAPDGVTAMDFLELSEAVPQEGDLSLGSIDGMTAELFHYLQETTYHHPSTEPEDWPAFAEMMKKRNKRPHEEVISGTNVYSFITRDGAEGVLEIAGMTERPAGVKIRYKLAQRDQGGASQLKPVPAEAATELSTLKAYGEDFALHHDMS